MKEIDRNACYLDAKVFYEAVSHFGNDNYEAAQDAVSCPLYLLNLYEYGGSLFPPMWGTIPLNIAAP